MLEKRRQLPAVMGRVLEEMCGRDLRGKLTAAPIGRRTVVERRGEPRIGDIAAPREYRRVGYFPLSLEPFEFIEHIGPMRGDRA